jgi:RNA polymerase sigma factor (sigma-70 family)
VTDLEEMYRRHLAPVWRYVRARIPDDHEAEDVTSDVFVRAFRSRDRFDPFKGSEGAWLAGIARHSVADWWRRRPAPPADHRDGADDAAGPEEQAVRLDTAAEVRRHLKVLSDRERDAIALRFAAGLRSSEVGAAMGISEAAAKMLVHRAVGKLRGVMGVE